METQSPGAETPVTSEQVKEAQKQTEDSYVALMDEMEASVTQNGDFFIKVGKVSENPMPYTDTRALILKEGRPKKVADGASNAVYRGPSAGFPQFLNGLEKPPQLEEYMTITREGLKIIAVPAEDSQNLLTSKSWKNDGFYNETRGKEIVWEGKAFTPSEIIGEEDEKFFAEAIAKSIDVSRATSENAKNKVDLDAAIQEQTRAQRVSDLFNNAIQPPNSGGQATPLSPLTSTG